MRFLMAVVIFGFLSICVDIQAQQITYDGCHDINGVPVASVRNSAIQDIATASLLNGNPVIYYNPSVLASVRPATRLFFYAHECGHHAIGHVLSGLRLGQEQEADCWGIIQLKKLNLVTDGDIATIQRDIAAFGRGDWTHLPGPQRAINLRACLNGDDGDEDSSEENNASANRTRNHGSDAQNGSSRRGHWEYQACTHSLHPNGDVGPCQHVCGYMYGRPIACHQGDVYPCTHPAHPAGDRIWISD